MRARVLLLAAAVSACSRTALKPGSGSASAVGAGGAGGVSASAVSTSAATSSAGGAGGESTSAVSGSGVGGACSAPTCVGPWARLFAPTAFQGYLGHLNAVAADPCGNLNLLGELSYDTIDFGGLTLSGSAEHTGFVVSVDGDGNARWGEVLGAGVRPLATGTDLHGNLYVAGTFLSSMQVGDLFTDDGTLFLVAIDRDGHALWLRGFGGVSENEVVDSLAVTPSGRVTIAGHGDEGGIDFGGGALASGLEGFIATFDGFGNHLWSRGFGVGITRPSGLGTDSAGDILITGGFAGSLDLGGGDVLQAAAEGHRDVFLGKIDAGGAVLWSRRFGDATNQDGRLVGVDAADEIVTLGEFTGSIDFGGSVIGAPDVLGIDSHVYLAKFTPNGEHLFSEQLVVAAGPPTFVTGFSIEPDGAMTVTVDLATGAGDVAAIRTDASGVPVSTKTLQLGYGAPQATRGPMSTAIAGMTVYPVDLGTGELQPPGVFVARYCDKP